MDQATHNRLSTKINQSLKFLKLLIHICNELDFSSQNYETRQKYENQLRQLQNENLELNQEIIHFDERSNTFETLMQTVDNNLDILEEQQMNDEKRKELQRQALKLQKIGEDYVKEISKMHKMMIFLRKIYSRILEMFKVYIQNTQTSTDNDLKKRLNIDKLKQKIENLQRKTSKLEVIDEYLLKKIVELQCCFESSIKNQLQMCAENKTEQASTESNRDGGNESLDQFFDVLSISTYFEI